jgi:hypothetical protein
MILRQTISALLLALIVFGALPTYASNSELRDLNKTERKVRNQEVRKELKDLQAQLKYLKLLEKKGPKALPNPSKTKGFKVQLASLSVDERKVKITVLSDRIKELKSDYKYLRKLDAKSKKAKEPKQPSIADQIKNIKVEIARLNAEEIKYANGFYDAKICAGTLASACATERNRRISQIQIQRSELIVKLTELGG